ncbi:hypothetical protein [Massilia varians]|uniref:hypothetical protein n=1 Tax=Massilia varians TaxID=457921 RepID=UPI002553DB5D|nr:hypothetical protein [Massilia varians]
MEVMQVQGEARLQLGSVSGMQDGGQAMAAGEGGAGESGFNKVMKTWARWMTLADHQHSNGWANPQDVKEFMACGTAVENMIDDLPRIQWWAVRKAFGIATVWRFPDYSYEQALEEAERTLSRTMQRNVATRRYFH